MRAEPKVRGPRWTVIFIALFAFFAYGAFTSGALTLASGWAVLAFSAYQRLDGAPARRTWLIGIALVVGYLVSLLVGLRLP